MTDFPICRECPPPEFPRGSEQWADRKAHRAGFCLLTIWPSSSLGWLPACCWGAGLCEEEPSSAGLLWLWVVSGDSQRGQILAGGEGPVSWLQELGPSGILSQAGAFRIPIRGNQRAKCSKILWKRTERARQRERESERERKEGRESDSNIQQCSESLVKYWQTRLHG